MRDHSLPRASSPAFFLSTAGTRLFYENIYIYQTFRGLLAHAGLRPLAGGNGGPRIHSLRHTFAVGTLSDWYRAGLDVPALMPRLSSYLRACRTRLVVLISAGNAGAAAVSGRTARALREPVMTLLAPTLEAYFTERLIGQRRASPHTIASYRDTFVLLLAFT